MTLDGFQPGFPQGDFRLVFVRLNLRQEGAFFDALAVFDGHTEQTSCYLGTDRDQCSLDAGVVSGHMVQGIKPPLYPKVAADQDDQGDKR